MAAKAFKFLNNRGCALSKKADAMHNAMHKATIWYIQNNMYSLSKDTPENTNAPALYLRIELFKYIELFKDIRG